MSMFTRLGAALVLAFIPATAFANDQVVFDSCKKDLKLSDSGCECVVREVNDKLNAKQLDFFLAAITNNQQKMMEAQGKVTGDEMMELANFMTVTPKTCENQ